MTELQAARPFSSKKEDEEEDVATAAALLQLHASSKSEEEKADQESRQPNDSPSPSFSASSPDSAGDQREQEARAQPWDGATPVMLQRRHKLTSTAESEHSDTGGGQRPRNKRTRNRIAARRYREARKADDAKEFLTSLKQKQLNQALKKQLAALASKLRKRLRKVEAKATQDQRLAAALTAASVSHRRGHRNYAPRAWSRRIRALLRDPEEIVKEQLRKANAGSSVQKQPIRAVKPAKAEATDSSDDDDDDDEYTRIPSSTLPPKVVAAALMSTSAPTRKSRPTTIPPTTATAAAAASAWQPYVQANSPVSTMAPVFGQINPEQQQAPHSQRQQQPQQRPWQQPQQHQRQQNALPACMELYSQPFAGAPSALANLWHRCAQSYTQQTQAQTQPRQNASQHQAHNLAAFAPSTQQHQHHQQHQQHQHHQQPQQQFSLGPTAHASFHAPWTTAAPAASGGQRHFIGNASGMLGGAQAFAHLAAPAAPAGQGMMGAHAASQPHPRPAYSSSSYLHSAPAYGLAPAASGPMSQQPSVQDLHRGFDESQQPMRLLFQQQPFPSQQPQHFAYTPSQQVHQ